MSDKIKNIISSIGFLAIGAFFYLQSTGIKIIMKKDLGSGFFPKVIGVSMIIMAVVELALPCSTKRTRDKAVPWKKSRRKQKRRNRPKKSQQKQIRIKKGWS